MNIGSLRTKIIIAKWTAIIAVIVIVSFLFYFGDVGHEVCGHSYLPDPIKDIPFSNELSPGAFQLQLFFQFPNWSFHNIIIYACAFAALLFTVFMGYLLYKRPGKQHSVIEHVWPALPAVICVLAFLNLSVKQTNDSEADADGFFVYICLLSIFTMLMALWKTCKNLHLDNFRSKIRIVRIEQRKKTLLWAAVAGWAAAYLAFFIGIYAGGIQQSVLAAIARPAFSACKMFFMVDNVIELAAPLRQSGSFMGFYMLVKVYVLAITTSTILFLVFSRWTALHATRRECAEGKKLYAFFGMTRASQMLANDINRKKEARRNNTLLFIENQKEERNFFNSVSFGGVMNLFAHQSPAYGIADNLGARLIVSNVMMSSEECGRLLNQMELERLSADDIKNSLGLKHFFRLLGQAEEAHCFFLYDDQQININGTNNLHKLINKVSDANGKLITIHCLAHKSGNTQMLEIPEKNDKTEVCILDSSQLAVQQLMQEPNYHPVNFVEIDHTTASVKSSFEALIIGFGETGQDALKFLYEFGAFLHHDCAKFEDAERAETFRSPFHCDVVDAKMDILQPMFLNKAPCIRDAYNMHKDSAGVWQVDKNDPLVSFHKAYYGSQEYVTLIEEKMRDVDYVVIALGSDSQNITVMNSLLETAVKMRNGNLGKLKIFVRSYYNDYAEVFHRLTSHYNHMKMCDGQLSCPIVVFGQEKDLFTFDMVIRPTIIERAKLFHSRYGALTGDNQTWEARHNKLKPNDKEEVEWKNWKKVKRQELQGINNELHAPTKLRLVSEEKAPALFKMIADNLVFNAIDRSAPIGFNNQSEKALATLCTNLARTEKLRWNASHQMMGYERNEGVECNEYNKTHNCLISWNELPDATDRYNAAEKGKEKKGETPYYINYQAMDYMVVKTTFELGS